MTAQALPGTIGQRDQTHPVAQHAQEDPLVALDPAWFEIAATIALLAYYGLSIVYGGAATLVANIVGPSCFSLIGIAAAYRALIGNRYNLWTPLTWYRITMAGYFGLGTLVPNFLNETTRTMLLGFFEFFPEDVLKLNIVVALFHLSVILTTWAILGPMQRNVSREKYLKFIIPCNFGTREIGFSFIAAGETLNYLIVYPTMLGIADFQRFGFFNALLQLGQIAYIGYFLVSYWAFQKQQRRWLWIVALLSLADMFVGMVQLSKSAAIFPVLMLPIAYLYYQLTLRRLLLVVAVMIPVYFIAGDIVSDARLTVDRDYEGRPISSDALAVLTARARGETLTTLNQEEYQISFARLSYVNIGSFAISQYDQGLPGDGLRHALIIWIPRVFYPDKPIVTDSNREFTFLATGDDRSWTSPTVPAEGYWTAGWLGVVGFAFITGIVLTFWSIYNALALQREAWHLLLAVVIGIRAGTRPDGNLVIDILGPISAAVLLHLIFHFANRLLPTRKVA